MDFERGADLTFQLPDVYEVELGFYDEKDTVLLSLPSLGVPASRINYARDYDTRCLIYVAGRLRWDTKIPMWISKQTLLRKSGILGANSTRNQQLLQQTLDTLKEQGFFLTAEIIQRSKQQDMVIIKPNPEKLRRFVPHEIGAS